MRQPVTWLYLYNCMMSACATVKPKRDQHFQQHLWVTYFVFQTTHKCLSIIRSQEKQRVCKNDCGAYSRQFIWYSEPNCTVSKTFGSGDLKGNGERRPMPRNKSVWCFLPCPTLLPNVVGEWRTGSRPGSCIASSFQHLLNVTAVNMLNHLSSLPVAALCNSNLFGMSCG